MEHTSKLLIPGAVSPPPPHRRRLASTAAPKMPTRPSRLVAHSGLVAVVLACCCLAPPPVAGILGNSVFDSVRNVTESFAHRHDAMFDRFLDCSNNYTREEYARRGKPQKLYVLESFCYRFSFFNVAMHGGSVATTTSSSLFLVLYYASSKTCMGLAR